MEYRAFECQFFTVGGGFDQDKVLKVKCPGICPGRGCYTFVLIRALPHIVAMYLQVLYRYHIIGTACNRVL